MREENGSSASAPHGNPSWRAVRGMCDGLVRSGRGKGVGIGTRDSRIHGAPISLLLGLACARACHIYIYIYIYQLYPFEHLYTHIYI